MTISTHVLDDNCSPVRQQTNDRQVIVDSRIEIANPFLSFLKSVKNL